MTFKTKEFRKRKSVFTRPSSFDPITYWLGNLLPFLIIIVCLSIIAVGWLSDSGNDMSLLTQFLTGTFGTVAAWLLYGVVSIDLPLLKFRRNAVEKRELIDVLLREQYRDFHFHLRENELLCIRLWTLEKPGKEIRVSFSDRAVKVNIKTYLRYGLIESPYHVIPNQAETRNVLKLIAEKC